MPDDPRSGRKLWEALDREIGKLGENRGQILAHWEFQPLEARLSAHVLWGFSFAEAC
jgi:hypothetical protein